MRQLVSIILFVLMLYALDVNAQYKYYLYIGPSVSSTTGSGIPIRNSLKGACIGNYDDTTSTIIGINGRGGYIQTNGFLTEDNATFLSIVPIYKIPIGKYYSDPKDSSNFSCSKTCSNISKSSYVQYGLSIPAPDGISLFHANDGSSISTCYTYKEADDIIYVSPFYNGTVNKQYYTYDLEYSYNGSNWYDIKGVALGSMTKIILEKDKIVFPTIKIVENPNAVPVKPKTSVEFLETNSVNYTNQSLSVSGKINIDTSLNIFTPPNNIISYVSRTATIIFKVKFKKNDASLTYNESPWYTQKLTVYRLPDVKISCDTIKCFGNQIKVSLNVDSKDVQDKDSLLTVFMEKHDDAGSQSHYKLVIPKSEWGNDIVLDSSLYAGTHSFQYRIDLKGGENYTSIFHPYQIIQKDQLQISSLVNKPVSCNGGNDGGITLEIAGGVKSYSYNWVNTKGTYSNNSKNLTNLMSGEYVLTVTDANSCQRKFDKIIVTQPDLLKITKNSVNQVLCRGKNTGAINVSVNGGTTSYNYQWTGPNGFSNTSQNIDAVYAGSYKLTVTDANKCTDALSVQITEPTTAITINSTQNTPAKCFNTNTGALNVTAWGGTDTLKYAWSGPNGYQNNSSQIKNLYSGDYSLKIADANNCELVLNQTVSQPPLLKINSIQTTDVLCKGDLTGAIIANATGGSGTIKYQWSNSVYNNSSKNISGLKAGDYKLVVIDDNQCKDSTSVQVAEPQQAISIYSELVSGIVCNGDKTGAINASASGGTETLSYEWTGPSSYSSTLGSISGLEAGRYILKVKDKNACIKTDTTVIEQPTPIAIQLDSARNVPCYGENTGSIEITTGGDSGRALYHEWNSTKGFKSYSDDIYNLKADTYTVTVSDDEGCKKTLEKIITQPDAPLSVKSSSVTDVLCHGLYTGKISPVIVGGTKDYTYKWSSPNSFTATTKDIDGLAAGEYTLDVVDANNCNLSYDYTISQPPPISMTITSSSDVTCFGDKNGNVLLNTSGGTGALSYSWTGSNGFVSSAKDITGLDGGTYRLVVHDENGCIDSLKQVVTAPTVPLSIENVNVENIKCFGQKGQITVKASGGTPSYIYTAKASGYSDFTSFVDSLENLPAASNYTVSVTDAHGCTDFVDGLTITQPDTFRLDVIDSKNNSCFGDSNGYVELKVKGGSPGYKISKDGIGWIPVTSTYKFENLSFNSYNFMVRDTMGCIVTTPHLVSQPDLITPSAQIVNVTCKGDSDGQIRFSLKGGTGLYSLKLTGATTDSIKNVVQTAGFSGLKIGKYNLKVKDELGCAIESGDYTITEPQYQLGLNVDSLVNPLCYGLSNGKVALKANGGWGNYSYSLSPISNKNGYFENLAANSYQFKVFDTLGCSFQKEVTLINPALLKMSNIEVENLKCFEDGSGSIKITPEGGTPSYKYNLGQGFTDINERTNLVAGEYKLALRDSHGCTDSAKVTVAQPDLLWVDLSNSHDNQIVCTDSVLVTPVGGTPPFSLLIDGESFSCTESGYLIYDKPNGNYPLKITDINGCIAENIASISNLPKPEINLVTVLNAKCSYSSDGKIEVDPYSESGFVNVSWYKVDGGNNLLVSNSDTVLNGLSSGQYIAHATDLYGCTHDTTIVVNAPSAIMVTLTNQRNPRCYGYADGGLGVVVNGGNGSPYSFLWSNGSQVDSTGAVPSGDYSVIVSDTKGCNDTTTFKVVDPPSVKPNIPDMVTVCSNQDYEINAFMANATSYLWYTKDSIVSKESKAVLVDAGEYYLQIADKNSCTGLDSMTLVKSSGIIDANFMVAEQASVGDTLVLIEMSWPVPDSIEWHYPAAFTSVYHNDYSVYLVPQMEGTYSIGLTSYVGYCSEYIEKTISIVAAKGDGGKVSTNEPLIKDVNLFPNPNRGDFSVDIYLNREAETLVELYSIYGQRISFERVVGLSKYSVNVNQRLLPGIYLVRVTAGNETRSLRVVVE